MTTEKIYSTKQVAAMLGGMKISTLSGMVWAGRIPAPAKSPSGDYLWQDEDVETAARILRIKLREPEIQKS